MAASAASKCSGMNKRMPRPETIRALCSSVSNSEAGAFPGAHTRIG